LQRVSARCCALQCAAVCCRVLQCVAVCCSVLHTYSKNNSSKLTFENSYLRVPPHPHPHPPLPSRPLVVPSCRGLVFPPPVFSRLCSSSPLNQFVRRTSFSSFSSSFFFFFSSSSSSIVGVRCSNRSVETIKFCFNSVELLYACCVFRGVISLEGGGCV